jgi:hypothetical protein
MAIMLYGWPGRRRRSQDMQTSGTHTRISTRWPVCRAYAVTTEPSRGLRRAVRSARPGRTRGCGPGG